MKLQELLTEANTLIDYDQLRDPAAITRPVNIAIDRLKRNRKEINKENVLASIESTYSNLPEQTLEQIKKQLEYYERNGGIDYLVEPGVSKGVV